MAEKDKENKEEIKKEFLIFKIDKNPKVNNSYKFLGLASTLNKAQELINNLSSNETGRVAILEKSAYFERKPAINLNKLNENINE